MHILFERANPYGNIPPHIVTPQGRWPPPLCFLSHPLVSSSTLAMVQNVEITVEVVNPYQGYGLRKVCTLQKYSLFKSWIGQCKGAGTAVAITTAS